MLIRIYCWNGETGNLPRDAIESHPHPTAVEVVDVVVGEVMDKKKVVKVAWIIPCDDLGAVVFSSENLHVHMEARAALLVVIAGGAHLT